jgi:hypothetical protein
MFDLSPYNIENVLDENNSTEKLKCCDNTPTNVVEKKKSKESRYCKAYCDICVIFANLLPLYHCILICYC